MSWVLRSYESNGTLVTDLVAGISATLVDAIGRRGRATLAVSGGSTPRTLFDALSVTDIPWSQVIVTLVDERWVPESDPASNALLVRQHLLRGLAAKARFVSLKNAMPDPFMAVDEVNRRLRTELFGEGQELDLILLGMGDDGHTASFFRDADGLKEALAIPAASLCCAVRPLHAPHARMTLTLDTVLQARRLMLHCIGSSKREVLQLAMKPGPVNEFPVRAVLHQGRRLLEIYYAERA